MSFNKLDVTEVSVDGHHLIANSTGDSIVVAPPCLVTGDDKTDILVVNSRDAVLELIYNCDSKIVRDELFISRSGAEVVLDHLPWSGDFSPCIIDRMYTGGNKFDIIFQNRDKLFMTPSWMGISTIKPDVIHNGIQRIHVTSTERNNGDSKSVIKTFYLAEWGLCIHDEEQDNIRFHRHNNWAALANQLIEAYKTTFRGPDNYDLFLEFDELDERKPYHSLSRDIINNIRNMNFDVCLYDGKILHMKEKGIEGLCHILAYRLIIHNWEGV